MYDIFEPTCLAAIGEYVQLNPCDTQRAEYYDIITNPDSNEDSCESARDGIDFLIYALCEASCDCISPFEIKRNQAFEFDIGRGNCMAHPRADICVIHNDLHLLGSSEHPAVEPAEGFEGPSMCEILDEFYDTNINKQGKWGKNFGSKYYPILNTTHNEMYRFLEDMLDAIGGTNSTAFWDECFALECAQNRLSPPTECINTQTGAFEACFTFSPTWSPSSAPTATTNPTSAPSSTFSPSSTSPTGTPSSSPTESLTETLSPTESPVYPSASSTSTPTTSPTLEPTAAVPLPASASPTCAPSLAPLTSTQAPTEQTRTPSLAPTSTNPTSTPSTSPTLEPTVSPSAAPSLSPTAAPAEFGVTLSPTGNNLCAPIYPDPGMWTDPAVPDIDSIIPRDNTSVSGYVQITLPSGLNADTKNRNSFVVTNKAGESVKSILIEVTGGILRDLVFESSAEVRLKSKTGLATGNGSLVFQEGTSNNFKGFHVDFDNLVVNGEAKFGVDSNPSSTSQMSTNNLNSNSYASWVVKGMCGAEFIGSKFVVEYASGATSMGYIGSSSQFGSAAKAKYREAEKSVVIKFVSDDGITRSDEKRIGMYGGAVPVVEIEGQSGDKVRISIIKAFNPVQNANMLGGSGISVRETVENRLASSSPRFPVNNIYDLQSREYTLGGAGSLCISSFADGFDFSPIPSYAGKTYIAIVANVIDNDGFPEGPVATIFLFPSGVDVSESCGSVLCPATTASPTSPVPPLSASPTCAPSLTPLTSPSTSPTLEPTVFRLGMCPESLSPPTECINTQTGAFEACFTFSPTWSPSSAPTATTNPTSAPSSTFSPSSTSPTGTPSSSPTESLTETLSPTESPVYPSASSTSTPTTSPTLEPTAAVPLPASASPTCAPSLAPLTSTQAPTEQTRTPSLAPTSTNPTSTPSTSPTLEPTVSPSAAPSLSPTAAPAEFGVTLSPTGNNLCAPIYPDPGMWTDPAVPDIDSIIPRDNTSVSGYVQITLPSGLNADTKNRNSFVVTNKAGESVKSILIEVTGGILRDLVFESSAEVRLKSKTGLATGNGSLVFQEGTSNNFKGFHVDFDNLVVNGEAKFGVDSNPSSTSQMSTNNLNSNSYASWVVKGMCGAEFIGSKFVVEYASGATSMGYIGSSSQFGSAAKAKYREAEKSVVIKFVSDDGITRSDEKRIGMYGGAVPVVEIEGQSGDKVRISIIKAFNPVQNANMLGGSGISVRETVENRLASSSPRFPVNNIYDLQSREYTLGGAGSLCISSFADGFDFSPIPSYAGKTYIAIVANVIDNDGFPEGPVATIFLFPSGVDVSESCGSVLCSV
eukprot:CAMPEP_0167785020 /NCGR_PEP_ID=MMETSP0111_2-20121227/8009_1 /TAXON_ID=91324 /ORGANISM="Lotharella globosa, Strain CCCM811" /LENGTH=1322 /DNA_ID=CAMNT_0007676253 /DNA_START=370 /DNA_END=4339 /DNA_ORIENTATION=-